MGERLETLMRIIVGIITGIIIYIWAYLIGLLIFINFFWTLISGRRIRQIAEMTEIWNTQKYACIRYIGFVTNERPFPFSKLEKSISKFRR